MNVNLTNLNKKNIFVTLKGPDIEEIPEQLMHTEAMVISNITKTFKGTIHLRRRHSLGGRGQKFAEFADR